MENFSKIYVLSTFRPFLHRIKAFNSEHFHQSTWHLGVPYAICSIVMIFTLSSIVLLGVWNLIDIDAGFKKLVVALPLIITLFQLDVMFVALVMKNHVITGAIDRLQEVIDQREL